jgi:hypothetical protein
VPGTLAPVQGHHPASTAEPSSFTAAKNNTKFLIAACQVPASMTTSTLLDKYRHSKFNM